MKQDTDIQAKQQGEIILYQPDETVRLEVRLEDDTVWLNQAQMGELFGTNRQAITKHLQNIYDCEELKKESTSSILELVRREGNRNVRRKIEFYNLDAIISVGFRVNTKRGIEFRQWANRVLKEYLLRGHVVNSRIMALEQRVEEQGSLLKEVQQKIDFFVRTSLPPVEGIFYDGQIFDAYAQIISLIKYPAPVLIRKLGYRSFIICRIITSRITACAVQIAATRNTCYEKRRDMLTLFFQGFSLL